MILSYIPLLTEIIVAGYCVVILIEGVEYFHKKYKVYSIYNNETNYNEITKKR